MKKHALVYRANTPAEKKSVIKRLEKLWLKNPELRLGQLIGNVFNDPYYPEDFDLIGRMEIFYEEHKKASN